MAAMAADVLHAVSQARQERHAATVSLPVRGPRGYPAEIDVDEVRPVMRFSNEFYPPENSSPFGATLRLLRVRL